MAVTASSIKSLFTEFAAVADARVDLFIAMAARQVNETQWDATYDDGVSYLTAHLLAMDAAAGGLAPGPQSSYKVGDVSATFAVSPSASSSSYESTSYGRHYVSLRNLVFPTRVV